MIREVNKKIAQNLVFEGFNTIGKMTRIALNYRGIDYLIDILEKNLFYKIIEDYSLYVEAIDDSEALTAELEAILEAGVFEEICEIYAREIYNEDMKQLNEVVAQDVFATGTIDKGQQ